MGCCDGRIRILDFDGKKVGISERWNSNSPTQQAIREIRAIALSPDGSNIVTGSQQGEVGIWDAENLRWLGTLFSPVDPVRFSNLPSLGPATC